VVQEALQHDTMSARLEGEQGAPPADWRNRLLFLRLAASGLAILAGWLLTLRHAPEPWIILCFGLAMLIGGFATIRQGLRALARLRFDMNGMMTVAVIGAALIGQWEEGAVVAFLYAVSNWLEGFTQDRARRSIRGLMDLAPRTARVRRDGAELVIPVEEIAVGDRLLIQPGEKLPADGVIRAGASAVNQAAITGESVPVDRAAGDPVYAGTLNAHGALEVEATRRADDTTLAHIIHLVEEAQSQRAPSQQFVDRFARIYTPIVFAIALAVMVCPPLFFGAAWGAWIYRGLALLILSCPCALVVSTPVTIVSAISAAARHGIMIKGGAHLEELGRIQAVALDKTGTLTLGHPEVVDILSLDHQEPEQVLSLAAAVEAHSEHPLARAIVRAARHRDLPIRPARDFTALPGQGGHAMVEDEQIYVGSPRLFAALAGSNGASGAVAALESKGKTVILVGTRRGATGLLALADPIRPAGREAIAGLRAAGIRHVAVLTGDNRRTAERVAEAIGADALRAEVLPDQKLQAVRALREVFGSLAMVGDGVNDAPALAASNVGIAMGAASSDAALETADVALMSDDLSKLPYLVHLGRHTVRVIRQNIGFALGLKLLAIAAVFPGWLTLWLAVLGDMGATVLVTLNGMRLLRDRPGH
jgi:Zn2+/Cd2+-exporting ATPase